jgi:hypothetical protein
MFKMLLSIWEWKEQEEGRENGRKVFERERC